MNLQNMSQKSLFENYMSPPPIISRCYSSKANVNTFTTPHHFRGNSIFRMNNVPNNMGHFNRTAHNFAPTPGPLKMTSAICKNSFCDPIKIVGNSLGDPVKIVGGFVGSKSQAGSTNHRGREFSLWDVILDKIAEVMDRPEPKQTQAPKNMNKKKENAKLEGFSMITTVDCEMSGGCGATRENWAPSEYPLLGVFEDGSRTLGCAGSIKIAGGPGVDLFVGLSQRKGSYNPHDSQPAGELPAAYAGDKCDSIGSELRLRNLSGTPLVTLEPWVEPLPAFRDDIGPNHPLTAESFQTNKTGEDPSCQSYSSIEIPVSCAPNEESSNHFAVDSFKSESEDDSIPSDLLSSSCESQVDTFPRRSRAQRSISECSASSDDSFIVFENPEDEAGDIPDDDTVIFSDDTGDEYSSSDEELDELDNCILLPHNCEVSPPLPVPSKLQEANQKWNESYADANSKSDGSTRKVRFADGKDLVKVKRLVAWDYAHRAARVGPWEMYRRDSERFKMRIASLSSVISPVLAEEHRKTIFCERFQT